MFKFENDKCYKMPVYFGGAVFDPDVKTYYKDVVTLAYCYTTDGDQLADYLPEGFELTMPELVIQYQQCRQVEWMAGSYTIWLQLLLLCDSMASMTGWKGHLPLWFGRTRPRRS